MVHGGGEKDGGGSTDGVPPPCAHTLVSLLRARSQRSAKADEKVEWVRSQLVGSDAEFETPFGRRALLYADHTASGRSLRYIEDYIVKHVLPFYGQWCSGAGAPYSFRMQHRCMHACMHWETTTACMRLDLDRSTHTQTH